MCNTFLGNLQSSTYNFVLLLLPTIQHRDIVLQLIVPKLHDQSVCACACVHACTLNNGILLRVKSHTHIP